MGFFDRFKKKENNNMPTNQPEMKPYDIKYSIGSNGTIQIDFYDRNADFKQFYDTTRLVIFSQSTLAGQMVQNCAVSWYGSNDCLMMDKARGTFVNGRAEEYSYVMTQLDLNLLQNDPEYCSVVMKQLLNQKRVRTYLEKGLQEALREKEIEQEEQIELSEEKLTELNNIFNKIEIGSKVKIKFYKNNKYIEIKGTITNIDYIKKKIQIEKIQNINISDIVSISI